MSRTKVARTRLTPDEYAQLEQEAGDAGVSPSEFLRRLIVDRRGLPERLSAIEGRLEHIESEMARVWLKEREVFGD